MRPTRPFQEFIRSDPNLEACVRVGRTKVPCHQQRLGNKLLSRVSFRRRSPVMTSRMLSGHPWPSDTQDRDSRGPVGEECEIKSGGAGFVREGGFQAWRLGGRAAQDTRENALTRYPASARTGAPSPFDDPGIRATMAPNKRELGRSGFFLRAGPIPKPQRGTYSTCSPAAHTKQATFSNHFLWRAVQAHRVFR